MYYVIYGNITQFKATLTQKTFLESLFSRSLSSHARVTRVLCTLSAIFFLSEQFFSNLHTKIVQKNIGHHACLRKNEHLFRCGAMLEDIS